MGNNLTSAQSLAYQGTNAASPSNVTVHYNAPTANFYQGFSMGDFWVHRISPTSNQNELWVLMGVAGNVANWVLLTGNMGPVLSLTGNSGGAVFPLAGNINVVGDGTTIQVVGNPGTHTLTISAMGIESLTTDDGHVVTPTGGTINVLTGLSTLNCGKTVEFTGTVGPNTVTLHVTDSHFNTIIGNAAGSVSMTTAEYNTGVGSGCLSHLTTGTGNNALGAGALDSVTSGSSNVAIGEVSLGDLTTGQGNIAIGHTAGISYLGTETANILLNSSGIITESNTLHIGSGTGTGPFQLKAAYISGIDGVNVGSVATVVTEHSDQLGTAVITAGSGISVTPTANVITIAATNSGTVTTLHTDDGHDVTQTAGVINISTGYSTQNCGSSVEFTGTVGPNTVTLNVTDANNNTVVGKGSGAAITSGSSNTILGQGAFVSAITASSNTIIGKASGTAYTGSESYNTIIGSSRAGIVGTVGEIRIGTDATHYPDDNIFIGNNSGTAYVAGGLSHNIGIGTESLKSVTSGYYNVCIGNGTGSAITTGIDNNLMGNAAGFYITGTGNTGIGEGAFYDALHATGLTSGSYNIALGYTAGANYTSSESNNIVIGTTGVNGESKTIRLGAFNMGETLQTSCFIQGIYGATTSGVGTAVLIDSTGNLGTISSSIRYKENVKDMADESSPLMKLRPVTFNYKKHGNKDYGLIAEEVNEVFPDLVVYNDQGDPETIKYHILCSILLNEVQKLEKRVKKLESKL